MNRVNTASVSSQPGTGDLRRRAEARLRKELTLADALPQDYAGRQLYELRVEQIEIELLSEEFNRLRQKITTNHNNRQVHDSLGRVYFFLDRDGTICDVASTRRVAVQEMKWRGLALNDCLPLGKRALFRDFLHEVFESDEKNSCELSFKQACGRKHPGFKLPLHAMIEAVSDTQKRLCLLVLEDISAQKVAEEREKASKAALAMLDKAIAASRNEIFMFDAQGHHFTFANHRALENLGYGMNELKSLTPADIQTRVSRAELNNSIAHLLSHEINASKFNAVHKRKDGSLYPVEIYLQLFEQEAGSYFIAIVLDISSQTAIESQMKSIMESARAIIWAADVDLKLMFMSDQVHDILGYSASQFSGTSLIDLLDNGFFHESDRTMLLDGFSQLVKGGSRVSDLRYRARHADGTWRWLSMNMTSSRSVDGQVNQMVGVMHDIHAQKLAEDALLQLNQQLDSRVREEIQKNKEKDLLLQRQARLAAMGEMIGNIAHQWRQPINSLSLILGDLEDASLYGECDLAYIQTAVRKSRQIIQKMSSTIDDFRYFYRADKHFGLFGLKQVTEECINLVEASMKSSNIKIDVRCEHDVVVSGYANEYSQALMNILTNARDAIVGRKIAAGVIVIEISEDGEFGVHTVTDNGGGIPLDVLSKIFEPHFTTKEHGVGIGLYMSLVSIEKNMNGRISAENVAEGARFSVYLYKARTGDEHVVR